VLRAVFDAMRHLVSSTAMISVLVACGATPALLAPPTRLPALAAIRSAVEHDAMGTPEALVQLALANEELQLADQQIETGRMTEAALLLAKAQADAELATRRALTVPVD
jgi:hypothetical protein